MIHAYRRAVARGHALPILCPDCKNELVPVVDQTDDPALKCLSCRTLFTPGLDVWNQIEAALEGVPTHIDDYYEPRKND